MPSVLFVCSGNICRSPTAHGLFRQRLQGRGLVQAIGVDSCGLEGFHVGEPPDPRAQEAAKRRGLDIGDLRARQLAPGDFARFDYLLAMDSGHLKNLQRRQPKGNKAVVERFLAFAPAGRLPGGKRDVPDPYYGGAHGFEHVLDQIEVGCEALLDELQRRARPGA